MSIVFIPLVCSESNCCHTFNFLWERIIFCYQLCCSIFYQCDGNFPSDTNSPAVADYFVIPIDIFPPLKSKGMAYRSGTDADAARVVETFRTLGYAVKPYNDLTCKQMVDVLLNGE